MDKICFSIIASIFLAIDDSDIFKIVFHGFIELFILLATHAIYVILVLSSLSYNGYPLNDLIQPGNVFLVFIDGILICIAITRKTKVSNNKDKLYTSSYGGSGFDLSLFLVFAFTIFSYCTLFNTLDDCILIILFIIIS